MVTRSIVGRFLILMVLLVSLGVIAQAALIITRGPAKKVASVATAAPADPSPTKLAMNASTSFPAPTPSAATPVATPAPAADAGEAAPVRVVYPGPLGNGPVPLRKVADPAAVSPLAPPVSTPQPLVAAAPTAPVAAPAAVASVPAAPAAVASVAAAPAAPPAVAAPVVSSVEVASADPNAAIPPASDATAPGKGGVDLNSASVEALNHVGGGHIGQSIVSHRPYHSVEDLMKKRVLRRAVYEQIKNQVAAQ